jgi:hypothetical protein
MTTLKFGTVERVPVNKSSSIDPLWGVIPAESGNPVFHSIVRGYWIAQSILVKLGDDSL